MRIKKNPDQEQLKSVFDYHPDGFLIWKSRPLEYFSYTKKALAVHASWNDKWAGKRAGSLDRKGYYQVNFSKDKQTYGYKLHRLIYSWHFGEIEDGMQVDHKDGNVSNNRIENLRLATHGENRSNARTNNNSTSKIKGISMHRGKWLARVQKLGVRREKSFDDISQAKSWIKSLRVVSHEEFANHGA